MGYAMLYDTDNLCYIFYNASIPIGNDLFQSYGASDANPNLLIYLSQDVAVNDTYLKNLILNGEAVAITLTSSANAFYAPQAFAAKSISYTQSYTYPTYIGESAGWRSLSLPFSPTTITHSDGRVLAPFNSNVADSKPFWLRRLTSNGFENATSIEANTPYIIAMPNDSIYDEEYRISGDVTFSATNVTVSATPETLTQDTGPEFNLTPIYEVRSASTGIYLLNETATTTYYAGSRFVRNNRSAHPFEAILISNPISASAPAYYRVGGTSSAKTRTTRTADGKPHIDDL